MLIRLALEQTIKIFSYLINNNFLTSVNVSLLFNDVAVKRAKYVPLLKPIAFQVTMCFPIFWFALIKWIWMILFH